MTTRHIILTAEQADHVRGPSTVAPAILDPAGRQGGLFTLWVGVLDDPAHAPHREYLAALPQMDSDDPDFPAPLEDEAET